MHSAPPQVLKELHLQLLPQPSTQHTTSHNMHLQTRLQFGTVPGLFPFWRHGG